MIFRKFKKTLELNRTKIDFPGKKVYYDRMTLWIAIGANICMIILSIITYSFDKELGFLFIIPLCLIFIPELIRKLVFKNPVFIFQKDRFYNSFENYWFDKTNSKVSYQLTWGFPNWSGTIRITDLKEYIEIAENVFFLEDASVFRKEIKRYSDNAPILTYFD